MPQKRPSRRSFNVISVGTNGKPVRDFLFVNNSNLHPILHRDSRWQTDGTMDRHSLSKCRGQKCIKCLSVLSVCLFPSFCLHSKHLHIHGNTLISSCLLIVSHEQQHDCRNRHQLPKHCMGACIPNNFIGALPLIIGWLVTTLCLVKKRVRKHPNMWFPGRKKSKTFWGGAQPHPSITHPTAYCPDVWPSSQNIFPDFTYMLNGMKSISQHNSSVKTFLFSVDSSAFDILA